MKNIYQINNFLMKYFRPKRMAKFASFFNLTNDHTILDVGGFYNNWEYINVNPKLTILNLSQRPDNMPKHVDYIQGDALNLPFCDNSFDIVYSNSVIEHVGSFDNASRMASEMSRVGKGYYCQTPNYWFPMEPHLLMPFFHWLPNRKQEFFARYFSIWGLATKPTIMETHEMVNSINLLKFYDMKYLFPDAQFINEKLFGITKSLVTAKLP